MVELKKSSIEWKKLNWKILDSHHEAVNYTVSGAARNIYKGFSYVFFGPPVRRIFPSASNLNEVTMAGIYFTGKHFIRVIQEGSTGFVAELIKPNIPGLKQVTFCVIFVPAFNYRDWIYFGASFSADISLCMSSRIINITKMADNPEASSYVWLEDFVSIRNIDEVETTHIAVVNSRPTVNVDENEFFGALEQGIHEGNQDILNIIVNGEFCEFTLSQIRLYIQSTKGKGKGGRRSWKLPRGIDLSDVTNVGDELSRGKGSGYSAPLRPDHPINSLRGDLTIIQDTNIYQFNGGKLSQISIRDERKALKQHLRHLELVESVIQAKRKLINSNLRSSKPGKARSSSHESGHKSKYRTSAVPSDSSRSSSEEESSDRDEVVDDPSSRSSDSDVENDKSDKADIKKSKSLNKIKSDKDSDNDNKDAKKEKKDKKSKSKHKETRESESSSNDSEPVIKKKKEKKEKKEERAKDKDRNKKSKDRKK